MGFAAMARMGFRGRIEVAGIDLGTTNSVICVQALSSSVGEIDCIEDPANGSPLVPSVVSFLHRDEVSSHRRGGGGDNTNAATATSSPSVHGDVLVGHRAKLRIDMHPHSTFYHAKRFLGRPYDSDAVSDLRGEVEFDVVGADSLTSKPESSLTLTDEMMPLVQNNEDGVFFHVLGGYSPADSSSAKGRKESSSTSSSLRYHIPPEGIGSYVVRHLLYLASLHLGYDNIRSAVIAVPAKFDSVQRQATAIAFKNAGIRVARMLEEPTAAALAYGLHRKPNVNHILVYDFGGGTLDVSILHVSDGFVEVMASEGDDTLGGADFDSAVAKFLMVGGDADGRGVGAATGQVRRVAKALDALAAAAADNERQDGASGGDDGGGGGGGTVDLLGAVEERLAETCDVLEVTPLCHVSSFHTVAEKMKISLSSNDDTEYVEEECLGLPEQQDNGGKSWTFESFCSSLKPVKLSLTQNEFDQSVSHLYNRSLLPIRNVLKELDLEAEDIDEVVMVGGSTRLPMIRKLVKEELRVKALNTHIDPDITVAYGAASVID